jgi:superfamily II DNA helicase RecQ
VIYVCTYKVGEEVSEELRCAFYKAHTYDRSYVLQEWLSGPSGWIVAIAALRTEINIHRIVEVIHINRPYGLTSFAQQLGHGGRDGEIS